ARPTNTSSDISNASAIRTITSTELYQMSRDGTGRWARLAHSVVAPPGTGVRHSAGGHMAHSVHAERLSRAHGRGKQWCSGLLPTYGSQVAWRAQSVYRLRAHDLRGAVGSGMVTWAGSFDR